MEGAAAPSAADAAAAARTSRGLLGAAPGDPAPPEPGVLVLLLGLRVGDSRRSWLEALEGVT